MSTVYEIWQMEKRVWLNGPHENVDLVLPAALILVPPLRTPQRFEAFVEATRGVEPFLDVEFKNRVYAESGNATVISYVAEATHPQVEGVYRASCQTVYVDIEGEAKVLSHHHVVLPKE